MLSAMADSNVTRILNAAAHGDPRAARELLPLVYEELRRMAAGRMSAEHPGQTLQATALVHEVYLRLVDVVEAARRKNSVKGGGGHARALAAVDDLAAPQRPERLLAVDAALDRLMAVNPEAAELVKLRYFAGFSNVEAAAVLGVSPRKADQVWAYARAWLRDAIGADRDAAS
jgi:DNA-directed RNA polymerase specialized sigma24 family protein